MKNFERISQDANGIVNEREYDFEDFDEEDVRLFCALLRDRLENYQDKSGGFLKRREEIFEKLSIILKVLDGEYLEPEEQEWANS